MKKSILYYFALLLVFLSSSLFITSCKAKQVVKETSVTTVDKSREIDSLKNVIINQAMNQKIIVPVGQLSGNPCDEYTNAKIEEILQKLNLEAQSGDNSFEIKYNKILKQLEILNKIGQTSNTDTKVKDKSITTAKEIITVEIPVDKPLSQLQITLMLIGLCSGIYGLIKIVLFIKEKTPWV
jgi:hypothetical protein